MLLSLNILSGIVGLLKQLQCLVEQTLEILWRAYITMLVSTWRKFFFVCNLFDVVMLEV